MDARKNNFGLLIQHPQISHEKITQQLGLRPSQAANAGDLVTTPSGHQTGSRHRWSSWSYFESFEEEMLEERALALIEKLSQHSDFFHKIVEEKGKAMFIVRSSERKHVVCSLPPGALSKLADLKIMLEFEVFKPV